MRRSILSNDPTGLRLPTRNPSAVLVVAILWLAFACALSLYQLRAARRQAHRDLQQLLWAGKPDNPGIIAAFDRSNQNIDAAASGPCLLLSFTTLLLVNQLLRLKRRYNALAQELSTQGSQAAEPHETPDERVV